MSRLSLRLTANLTIAAGLFVSGSTLAAEASAEGGSLPQFNTTTFPSQIFWLLISFFTLYFLCAKIFLPQIAGIIEERRNSIADDFDQAAEFKRQAEIAEATYLAALADARARGAQIAAETRAALDAEIADMEAETNKKLEANIIAAEARIAETAEQARDSVREAAAEITKSLVIALIDETPGDDAIEAALTQVAGA